MEALFELRNSGRPLVTREGQENVLISTGSLYPGGDGTDCRDWRSASKNGTSSQPKRLALQLPSRRMTSKQSGSKDKEASDGKQAYCDAEEPALLEFVAAKPARLAFPPIHMRPTVLLNCRSRSNGPPPAGTPI
jgi:hypothetical protein